MSKSMSFFIVVAIGIAASFFSIYKRKVKSDHVSEASIELSKSETKLNTVPVSVIELSSYAAARKYCLTRVFRDQDLLYIRKINDSNWLYRCTGDREQPLKNVVTASNSGFVARLEDRLIPGLTDIFLEVGHSVSGSCHWQQHTSMMTFLRNKSFGKYRVFECFVGKFLVPKQEGFSAIMLEYKDKLYSIPIQRIILNDDRNFVADIDIDRKARVKSCPKSGGGQTLWTIDYCREPLVPETPKEKAGDCSGMSLLSNLVVFNRIVKDKYNWTIQLNSKCKVDEEPLTSSIFMKYLPANITARELKPGFLALHSTGETLEKIFGIGYGASAFRSGIPSFPRFLRFRECKQATLCPNGYQFRQTKGSYSMISSPYTSSECVKQWSSKGSDFSTTVRDGAYKEWYPDCKIRLSGQYLQNKKEGRWQTFDRSGAVMIEGIYQRGMREGAWVSRISKTKVLATFIQGSPQKARFLINDILVAEGSYLNSSREGNWNFWTCSGEMRLRVEYRNGQVKFINWIKKPAVDYYRGPPLLDWVPSINQIFESADLYSIGCQS